MFSRNPTLGLIKEIPISCRDISQRASCGIPGGQQHWWVGSLCQTPILPHYSAQVPLMYQPSDLHSCRAGGVACKHKEGERAEHGELGGLLHEVRAIAAPAAATWHHVSTRSNQSKNSWFTLSSPEVMNDRREAQGESWSVSLWVLSVWV